MGTHCWVFQRSPLWPPPCSPSPTWCWLCPCSSASGSGSGVPSVGSPASASSCWPAARAAITATLNATRIMRVDMLSTLRTHEAPGHQRPRSTGSGASCGSCAPVVRMGGRSRVTAPVAALIGDTSNSASCPRLAHCIGGIVFGVRDCSCFLCAQMLDCRSAARKKTNPAVIG